MAGRLKYFYRNWQLITSDPLVLETVKGYKIPILRKVCQTIKPDQNFCSKLEEQKIKSSIDNLLNIGAIELTQHSLDEFFSSYFIVPKPDNSYHFILNLKKFNLNVKTEHFKIEDVRTALNLMD